MDSLLVEVNLRPMKLVFSLIIIQCSSGCFAQSARDFFFPASGKNVSVYSKPATNGEKTLVYFKDMGDSALITTVYPDYNGKTGWTKEAIKIEDTTISLLSVKSNIYKPQTFNAGEVTLLKMPAEGGSSSEYTKGSTKQIYHAEFLTIKIGNEERRALKITKSSEMKHSGKKLMSYSDYYVQGIGYYKRTASYGIQIEILEEQKYDPNPPALK
jgi:Ca2+-binding RTX toxin-like protein